MESATYSVRCFNKYMELRQQLPGISLKLSKEASKIESCLAPRFGFAYLPLAENASSYAPLYLLSSEFLFVIALTD